MNCIRWSVNVRLTSSIEREKNSLDLIKVYWRRNLKTFAKKILNVIVKLYWNEFQRMKRELIETHGLCNPNSVEILMKEKWNIFKVVVDLVGYKNYFRFIYLRAERGSIKMLLLCKLVTYKTSKKVLFILKFSLRAVT